ncbi:hypothetical protein [Pseudoalteromonas prydzensis]|uniref:hypothetical protein n=1 Tax=Pseudoalteromonas prydzensis TaxID=182141 RepID=UPI003FD583CE
MKPWTKHSLMISLWIGAIVMGFIYLFGLKTPDESPFFIVGQIVLGGLGLAREVFLKRNGFKAN